MCSPRDPTDGMEDVHAQFLIAIGDLCLAAEVGGLAVEVITDTGERASGVPTWVRRSGPRGSAYSQLFGLSGRLVDLGDVVECRIRAPRRGAESRPLGMSV